MITIGEACLLGAIQGLTEFLPVSSSGHLAVVHQMLTPLSASQTAAVDVALHGGTLVAVVLYFRRDLVAMASSLRPGVQGGWQRRWIWLLALATVPAAVIGLPFKPYIESSFQSMRVVGVSFLVTGTLLYVAARMPGSGRDEGALGLADALLIGCCQALALLPGISRSGTTIAGGLFCGLDEGVAARFAFLMGVPAIAGAQLSQVTTLGQLDGAGVVALGAGMAVAAVSGVVGIWGLMRLLRSSRLHYFAFYLWPLGVVVLGSAVMGGV